MGVIINNYENKFKLNSLKYIFIRFATLARGLSLVATPSSLDAPSLHNNIDLPYTTIFQMITTKKVMIKFQSHIITTQVTTILQYVLRALRIHCVSSLYNFCPSQIEHLVQRHKPQCKYRIHHYCHRRRTRSGAMVKTKADTPPVFRGIKQLISFRDQQAYYKPIKPDDKITRKGLFPDGPEFSINLHLQNVKKLNLLSKSLERLRYSILVLFLLIFILNT